MLNEGCIAEFGTIKVAVKFLIYINVSEPEANDFNISSF